MPVPPSHPAPLHLLRVLLMAALRWASFLIGVECLICLFFVPRGLWSALLAAGFLLSFAAFGWSVGAFSSDSRKAKP